MRPHGRPSTPRRVVAALTAALLACAVVLLGGCDRAGVATHRLAVPAAGVDAPVVPAGLSPEGTISPDRGQLVWYTGHGRVAPGELGTAVVAGHVAYEGEPDVFAALAQVGPGDEVVLTGEDGSEGRWTVTEVDVVGKTALQRDPRVWGDQREVPRLVLITCDDELGFRPDGHRAANLVVVAEPAPAAQSSGPGSRTTSTSTSATGSRGVRPKASISPMTSTASR